ncbi:MAG: hypothetical protein ACREV6_00350 [Clostridium sp.]|uniref:hypothetical protein n=1 Tax=Clostridium sp. TaxID=1506 RepID=UPI003D6D67AA
MKKKFRVLIIILSLLMIASGCTKKKVSRQTLQPNNRIKNSSSYLDKNVIAINLEDNNNYSTFKLLEQDTLDNEIFLIGENHNIKDNYKVKIKFLKYFKEKANFKYLLMEESYISSILYNKYLETGNEEFLNKNFIPNKDDYEFWKNLYAYNLKLNTKDKIKIIGIDISNNKQCLEYILEMLANKALESYMKQDVVLLQNYLKLISNFGNNMNNFSKQELKNKTKELEETIDVMYNKIYSKENAYKKLLGSEYIDFCIILDSLKSLSELSYPASTNDYKSVQKIRDLAMYKNFKKLYDYLPKEKYFGQFGLDHAFQKSIEHSYFASYANNEEPLKGKITTIAIFYDQCMIPRDDNLQDILTTYNSKSDIEKYIKSKHTLIKLNNEKSPFNQELKWDFAKNIITSPKEGVTTNYFQYIIVIKDSYAAILN